MLHMIDYLPYNSHIYSYKHIHILTHKPLRVFMQKYYCNIYMLIMQFIPLIGKT